MPNVLLLTVFPLIALGVIFATLYWWQTLMEILNQEPTEGNDRLVWLIVVLSLHFFGALLYRYNRRPERLRLYGR